MSTDDILYLINNGMHIIPYQIILFDALGDM